MKALISRLTLIAVCVLIGWAGAQVLQGVLFISHYSERYSPELKQACENYRDSYARPLLYGQLVSCEILLRSAGETLFSEEPEPQRLRL